MIVSTIKFGKGSPKISGKEMASHKRLLETIRENYGKELAAKDFLEKHGIKGIIKSQNFEYLHILGLRDEAEKIELEMYGNGEIETCWLSCPF